MTSIPFNAVAEPYIRLRAVHHLDNGYIVIFEAVMGNRSLRQITLVFKEPLK